MLMVVVVVLLVKLFVFWTKVGELLVVLIFIFAVVVSCSLNSISDLIVFFSVFVNRVVGLLIVVEDNSRLFSVLTIIGVVM